LTTAEIVDDRCRAVVEAEVRRAQERLVVR
jgi:hypothetical protein